MAYACLVAYDQFLSSNNLSTLSLLFAFINSFFQSHPTFRSHPLEFYAMPPPPSSLDHEPERGLARQNHRVFWSTFERALVESLQFRKRGKVVRSGKLAISKSTFEWLRADHGLRGRWTDCSLLLSLGALPSTRVLKGKLGVSVRAGSFKAKVRRKKPIIYTTTSTATSNTTKSTCETFWFDFHFFKRVHAI